MQVSIFLYHRINPERDPFWDPIDPRQFERQIIFLKKNYTIVQLESFLDSSTKVASKKPLASIVFDDGYRDFMEYALPILQRHQVPSSMYVVTDCVDQLDPIWTFKLDYLFQKTKRRRIQIAKKEGIQKITWGSEEEKIIFAKKIKPELKKIKNADRENICQQIFKQLNDIEVPENLYMDWEDLREINREGVVIGSHTTSHAMLGNVEIKERIVSELKESANRIKEELGFFPKTISYPIGSYSPEVKKIAQELGYTYGLAVAQKKYKSKKYDSFEIPRLELYNESLLKTYLRTTNIWRLLNEMRNR
jgi:peptidoglycan/xylan/chitin deacetylase (PgdA/CDA1 family)